MSLHLVGTVTRQSNKIRGGQLTRLIMALAAAASFGACAAESVEEADDTELEAQEEGVDQGLSVEDESVVLASLISADGRQVKFVEVAPGVVSIMQAGEIGTKPLVSREMLDELEPAEIYSALSGSPAPELLQAESLEQRAELQEQVPPQQVSVVSVVEALSGSVQKAGFYDDTWVWNSWICVGAPASRKVRNGTTARDFISSNVGSADVIIHNTAFSHVTGSWKMRPNWSWVNSGTFNLAPNYYVTYHFNWPNGVNDFDAKTYVNPNGGAYTACQW